MSRTIRRTGDKKRNKSGRAHFEHDYTHTYGDSNFESGFYAWGCKRSVKLEGKEFDKAFWKFHRDNHNSYGWSNHTWDRWHYEQRCRMKNKEEIIRFLKDDEYEVIVYQPGCLSWER
jgi:hypothetical protein